MTNGKSSRGPVIIVPAPQLRRSLLEGTLLGRVGTRGSQLIILFSFPLFPSFFPLDTLTYKQDIATDTHLAYSNDLMSPFFQSYFVQRLATIATSVASKKSFNTGMSQAMAPQYLDSGMSHSE